METADWKKKHKYLASCLSERRHFIPFATSEDGLLGVEAEVTLELIASRLEQKWQELYSCTCGYMKSRFSITLVWDTHNCIQGVRVPVSCIRVIHPQW